MEFLKYANETNSNIIPKEEFQELVMEVFNTISSNLCKSLGPLGSSATILDGAMTEATKDGYSILKKYCFNNRYKRMIYNLIQKPCTKMNNTVGDGTTSVIALTSKLFEEYKLRENDLEILNRLPRNINKAWDEVVDNIVDNIKKEATPIDDVRYDTVYHLAYVSSNGSHEISENIAKIYSEYNSPTIKQKDSPTNKSYIEKIDGYEFNANMIDSVFAKNDDMSTMISDAKVMIFDFKIDSDTYTQLIEPIMEVIRCYADNKLIIIAPYFDELLCRTKIDQNIRAEFRRGISTYYLQYEFAKLSEHQLHDFATVMKTYVITQPMAEAAKEFCANGKADEFVETVLDPDAHVDCASYYMELSNFIGKCAFANMSCTNGSIFTPEDDIDEYDRYKKLLKEARNSYNDIKSSIDFERQSYASKIYDASRRVSQLEMQNFIYYIGADSSLQKQIIWDSVEDVIKCVRSAVKNGIVPGCQLSVIKGASTYMLEVSKELNEDMDENRRSILLSEMVILQIIMSAVLDVYQMVLTGPTGMGIIKTIKGWDNVDADDDQAVLELKNKSNDKLTEILNKSIDKYQVYDLETLEFSDKIITSAETDCMVLTAASELVKILISGNQCLFVDAEINGSHQETVEI